MKKINLRHRFRIRLFFEGAAVGIFTGVIISVLRYLLDAADIFRPIWFKNLSSATDFFLTVGGLILLAIFLSKSMQFDKQVGGSGVPQIKSILQGKAQMYKPIRLLAVKFISVVTAIGAGMSLGRAGISVQFGACVGNFFSKIFYTKSSEKILLAAGASAGFAAIFSAPLAGVIFCIEELHKKFSAETLVATVTASVSAAAVASAVFGVRPIFETIITMPEILQVSTLEMLAIESSAPLKFFLYFAAMAILLGAVGAIFTKSLLLSLDIFDKLKIKLVYKILIPLCLIVPLGKFLPEVLGCGNVLVDDLLSGKFWLTTILILFAGKFLFTLICFGTNVPGGIFLPMLTLGALGGNIFASVGVALNLFPADCLSLFTVFGMAAMFAAVVKAPVTGSVLIMEVTGQFSYLLNLIIISGVAFMVSDICGGAPIFSALLNRKKVTR